MNNIKEKLILAGIQEIEKNGVRNFSLRQVAKRCNVSCAAPFKHFKDKEDFINAINKYIYERWYIRQEKIKNKYPDDVETQLFEMIIEYIRFYVEFPYFIPIVLLNDSLNNGKGGELKHDLSISARRLIRRYCAQTNMDKSTEKRKTFIMKSIIYGAALLISNGDLEYNEENFELITNEVRNVFKS